VRLQEDSFAEAVATPASMVADMKSLMIKQEAAAVHANGAVETPQNQNLPHMYPYAHMWQHISRICLDL